MIPNLVVFSLCYCALSQLVAHHPGDIKWCLCVPKRSPHVVSYWPTTLDMFRVFSNGIVGFCPHFVHMHKWNLPPPWQSEQSLVFWWPCGKNVVRTVLSIEPGPHGEGRRFGELFFVRKGKKSKLLYKSIWCQPEHLQNVSVSQCTFF